MPEKRAFNHGDRESRRRKACERLGSDSPSCILCDVQVPELLELHHVAQHEFHPEMVPLCLNHHRLLSNMQKDHPPKIPGCINQLEIFGHFRLGLGDMLEVAADELRDPGLAGFLTYLRTRDREHGLLLIEIARRFPNLDMGITP